MCRLDVNNISFAFNITLRNPSYNRTNLTDHFLFNWDFSGTFHEYYMALGLLGWGFCCLRNSLLHPTAALYISFYLLNSVLPAALLLLVLEPPLLFPNWPLWWQLHQLLAPHSLPIKHLVHWLVSRGISRDFSPFSPFCSSSPWALHKHFALDFCWPPAVACSLPTALHSFWIGPHSRNRSSTS